MRAKIIIGFSALACVWLLATVVRAQQPTSRVIPFNNVATMIPASTPGQALTIQLWDAAATPPGTLLFSEAQTLDVDATGAISFVFGSQTVDGLDPANFPSGASRFLDVVDSTGASVLPPPGRIPLTAVAFALSAPHDVPGNLTMVNSTATAGNILKDGVLFLHNFGTDNTFLGQNAGNLTMTGTGNTASGSSALLSNTTGIQNTASGSGALRNNTTGIGNTASGAAALQSNTTGSDNTASGAGALISNTTGASNTASGASALTSNTTGIFNTASGADALFSTTTGSDNTASGALALLSNTGSENTASGFRALQLNTTGSFNTASGSGALFSNTTGSANTAIGAFAGVSVGNLTNATAIGSGAVVNASNKIRLGNTSVTVVETSGKVVASGGFNGACTTVFVPPLGGAVTVTCNQDVAETFASAEATEPGDLVVLVNQSSPMPTVRKSTRPYDSLLVGAVSTSPGLVFDRGETHLAGDNSKLITPAKTVVGLVGRVPVKISPENGPIAVGDPLTSSSTAGVAMKASRAGQIIGYALEKADQKGKILVHLQPSYYIPPKQLALLNQIDELKAQVSELQGLDAQARRAELGALRAENADLKGRIEKLERSVGSRAFAAKAE